MRGVFIIRSGRHGAGTGPGIRQWDSSSQGPGIRSPGALAERRRRHDTASDGGSVGGARIQARGSVLHGHREMRAHWQRGSYRGTADGRRPRPCHLRRARRLGRGRGRDGGRLPGAGGSALTLGLGRTHPWRLFSRPPGGLLLGGLPSLPCRLFPPKRRQDRLGILAGATHHELRRSARMAP